MVDGGENGTPFVMAGDHVYVAPPVAAKVTFCPVQIATSAPALIAADPVTVIEAEAVVLDGHKGFPVAEFTVYVYVPGVVGGVTVTLAPEVAESPAAGVHV